MMIWRIGLVVAMCTVSIVQAMDWRSKRALDLSASAYQGGELGPKKEDARYISYDLTYAPFEKLRTDLEARLDLKLENRGEAHITLVTPPEFSQLAEVLKPEEIRTLVAKAFTKGKTADIESLCVGQGTLRKGLKGKDQTWFVVVKFPAALEAREEIAKELEKRKASAVFKARDFHPHVTLGFLNRDLHSQDGVIKNISSCKFPFGQTPHSARH